MIYSPNDNSDNHSFLYLIIFCRGPSISKYLRFYKLDGLNNVEYSLVSIDVFPLYTRILVKIDGPTKQEELRSYEETFAEKYTAMLKNKQ